MLKRNERLIGFGSWILMAVLGFNMIFIILKGVSNWKILVFDFLGCLVCLAIGTGLDNQLELDEMKVVVGGNVGKKN